MLIQPQIYNIGTFNYFKTIFLGKGFEVYSIFKPSESSKSYGEDPIDEMSPEERGMLSISANFIILTYIKSDGKRRPVLVKACTLTDNNSGAHLLDVLGMEAETDNYKYLDQDGWEWSLILSKSNFRRSTFGTGSILISKEGEELYHIQLR